MTASPLPLLSSSPRSAAPAPGSPAPGSPAPPAFAKEFPERTTLTRRDRVVVRAVAEAMFSQDGEIDAARLDAHVDEIDAFISSASRPLRAGLRIALFVVRIAPVLLFYRLCVLERLSVDERVAVLARLERSRFAELSLTFIGWRAVMTFIVYEHPSELASLGYASERKVHKRRLALLAAPPLPAAVDAPETATLLAPVAEESGVRLRGDGDRDSDAPAAPAEPAAAPKRHEVA